MTDNLQMGVRTRRLARAVLGCAAICAAASARADDYVLAAGETDAFVFAGGTVTNFTSMTVAGSLEITGDGWIKTPTLNLDGGTLTVDGAKASIGTAHYRDQTPTTVTFTNAADGTYGICDMCGQLIRKPRLMNLPFVRTCMECQSEMENPLR